MLVLPGMTTGKSSMGQSFLVSFATAIGDLVFVSCLLFGSLH